MDYDFGELKNDVSFVSKVQNVTEAIKKIEDAIKTASEVKIDELTTEEKVKHDLFLVYAVNSLYFMYLRMNGENPTTHGIKHELTRVKEAMERQKQIHDHKTIRPVLKQDVAQRLVRGGLHDVKQKNLEFRQRRHQLDQQSKPNTSKIFIGNNPNPLNKKRKFDDD